MISTNRAAPPPPPLAVGTDELRIEVRTTSEKGEWEISPNNCPIPAGFSGHLVWNLPAMPPNLVFDDPGITFHGIAAQPATFSRSAKTCVVKWVNSGTTTASEYKYDIHLKFRVFIDPTVTNDGPP